jgi:hypothetical protein
VEQIRDQRKTFQADANEPLADQGVHRLEQHGTLAAQEFAHDPLVDTSSGRRRLGLLHYVVEY